MNCIVYLLDGLSPLAIKNKNNKNFLGKKLKKIILVNCKKIQLIFIIYTAMEKHFLQRMNFSQVKIFINLTVMHSIY